MFLPKLYKYNKGLFILFTGFLFLFIYINAKQGAVVTPVYQYGMFSEPFQLEDARDALVFTIDGKQLEVEKLSFPARDIMVVSLENYLVSRERNIQVFRSLQPLMDPVIDLPSSLAHTSSPQEFNRWYVEMVSRLTKKDVNMLEVYKRKVFWEKGLRLTTESSKIFPVAHQ